MYLDEVENFTPPKESGRIGRVIKAAREKGLPIPQIYHLFAWRMGAARHLGEYMEEVMRGPSELSEGFRELIASFTSRRNDCLF